MHDADQSVLKFLFHYLLYTSFFLLDQCYIVLHTVFSGAQGRTLYTSSDTCRSPAAPYPLDPEISRLERAGFYDWDC
jgi:hypothetical protein